LNVYFHVDMDAFYAAVEQHDNPELKGKPVIIGAKPGERGVVSACSYEARKFGVRSAMPVSEAYRRCPKGVYIYPKMKRYAEVSSVVMKILHNFSPEIHQISVDEAFLNMTGTQLLFGPPIQAAQQLKKSVKDETGLTISVGIAANRFLAKLASEFKKPDGLFEVVPGNEEEFLDQLELSDLWGIGKKTLERLTELNIRSIPDLRSYEESLLQAMMGKSSGAFLYNVVRGIDPGVVQETAKSHSVSNEITFSRDTKNLQTIHRNLLELSHQLVFRLFDEEWNCRTISLKIRYSDFTTTTIQRTLPHKLTSAEELFSHIKDLWNDRYIAGRLVRLIGIALQNLYKKGEPQQSELFEPEWKNNTISKKRYWS
jgi:DNA polymerase-4